MDAWQSVADFHDDDDDDDDDNDDDDVVSGRGCMWECYDNDVDAEDDDCDDVVGWCGCLRECCWINIMMMILSVDVVACESVAELI